MEEKRTELLTNTSLTAAEIQAVRSLEAPGHPWLFAVIGGISIKSEFCRSALLVSDCDIMTYEFDTGHEGQRVSFSDIKSAQNKRMYGNAILRLTLQNDDIVNIFRYTFAVNTLCESAATYINSMINGEDAAEAFACVEAVYEKQLSVCPKCGRALSSPGVECIHCASKKQVAQKLLKYITPEWKVLIISVIFSVATTALALIPPTLNKNLIDDILPNNRRDGLIEVALILIGIQFLSHFIGCLRGIMLRKVGDRVVLRIRNDVYEKAQYLPMRFYDKTSTGAVINRISGDSNTIQAFMLRISQEVVVQFFKMVGIIAIMLIKDWRLTLFSLIPVPIVVIGARIFSKKIRPFYLRIWARWTAVTSVLTDTIPGIRVVKSFTNEKNSTERFKKKNQAWYETDASAATILHAFPAVVGTCIGLGSIVIWWFGGNMVISGSTTVGGTVMTAGLLTSFISYASMFYEPVNFFANLNDSYQHALASAERILDILDAEPEHDFGKGNVLPEMKGKIEFRNVSFSFDRTKKTLKNINLTIEPGDVVGIVGTTGSGKSTLVNLFLRYYDNYDGEILVDGVNIRDIDMEYYRGQIGFVQQEPLMFHDTIFNNIAYGLNDCPVERVIQAADIANAHSFIVRQPDGYDAVLGERGVGLSGGERQRVSIARAVLRNPSVLVFDEATASVDSETEHLIQEAIERLIAGRTTIMIAHRLSTLSRANKIVVVDNGSIIECGTPEELLAMKGKYYKLVEIQSMSEKLNAAKAEHHFE
ncbi:MAG: ABC transporter ATP-binding protein/permease [Clostridia bacterium]|nr:ABC transporter ATP-binding protein/permease [Clostridia bacterium]